MKKEKSQKRIKDPKTNQVKTKERSKLKNPTQSTSNLTSGLKKKK